MKTNLRSPVVLTQLCISHLRKTKGAVVNVSSIAEVRFFSYASNYCILKIAVNMFTKCLALELAPDGVRVNSVNPGVIDTPICDKLGIFGKRREKYMEERRKSRPLGRNGTVDDVSESICFLASSRASFMTGNTTMIDGGRTCVCPAELFDLTQQCAVMLFFEFLITILSDTLNNQLSISCLK